MPEADPHFGPFVLDLLLVIRKTQPSALIAQIRGTDVLLQYEYPLNVECQSIRYSASPEMSIDSIFVVQFPISFHSLFCGLIAGYRYRVAGNGYCILYDHEHERVVVVSRCTFYTLACHDDSPGIIHSPA